MVSCPMGSGSGREKNAGELCKKFLEEIVCMSNGRFLADCRYSHPVAYSHLLTEMLIIL